MQTMHYKGEKKMFIRHLCFINLHKHIGKLVINMEIIITIEGINHKEVGQRRQKRNWKKQNTKVNIVSIKKIRSLCISSEIPIFGVKIYTCMHTKIILTDYIIE